MMKNRVGEINYNNFGSKMEIINYRDNKVKKRVEMIIFQQMRKYQYLFSEH